MFDVLAIAASGSPTHFVRQMVWVSMRWEIGTALNHLLGDLKQLGNSFHVLFLECKRTIALLSILRVTTWCGMHWNATGLERTQHSACCLSLLHLTKVGIKRRRSQTPCPAEKLKSFVRSVCKRHRRCWLENRWWPLTKGRNLPDVKEKRFRCLTNQTELGDKVLSTFVSLVQGREVSFFKSSITIRYYITFNNYKNDWLWNLPPSIANRCLNRSNRKV